MKEVTTNNFEQEVLKSNIPVLVDFTASWCGPCKQLSPIIEQVESEYSQKIKFAKVNIEEAQELATKYMVMSIPSLILFKDGH